MPARQGLGQFPFEYDFHIREIPKQYATIILKRDEGGKYFKSSVRFGAKSRPVISSYIAMVHVFFLKRYLSNEEIVGNILRLIHQQHNND